MRITDVQVEHYRGWRERISWKPGQHAVLVGPNNAGKTTLRSAVDLVLNRLDFKSPLYARTVCEQLSAVPPTVASAIEIVHALAAGDPDARGDHDL